MAAAILLSLLLLSPLSHAFRLTQSREEMLGFYYTNIEAKIPRSAHALIGDEKVNVFLGGKVIGLEMRRGELYSFELYPVQNPTIIITVNDDAAEAISQKRMGLLSAVDSGGIKIQTTNWLSGLRVETIKRIYAISGADSKITNSVRQAEASNAIYVQRVRVWG